MTTEMGNSSGTNDENAPRALPTSMDWFRQSANWLVGLSLAALAWLGGRYEARTDHAWIPLEVLYACTALAFVVAVLCGIGFYHWLTYFASLYEREDPKKPAATPETPGAADNADGRLKDSPRDKARRRYGHFFNALKFAFPLGVLLSIATIVTERYGSSTAVAAGSVLLIDGRAQDSTCTKYSVLKLDTKSGLVLELHNDPASGWVRWDTCHAFAREVVEGDKVYVR